MAKTKKEILDKLYQLRNKIKRNPKSFHMHHYNCGMAACLAGWTVALDSGKSLPVLKEEGGGNFYRFRARRMLGITEATADWLFLLREANTVSSDLLPSKGKVYAPKEFEPAYHNAMTFSRLISNKMGRSRLDYLINLIETNTVEYLIQQGVLDKLVTE